MAKKVIYAKLHDSFFIPGIGNMKDTLPSDSKTLKDFEMSLEDDGSLLLQWTVLTGARRIRKNFVIGAATVKGALLEDEDVTPKSE